MAVLLSLPAVLCLLALGAHFLFHGGSYILVIGSVGLCVLLFSQKRWPRYIVQAVLALAAIEWLFTTYDLVQRRQEHGEAWLRGAVILLGVACLNVVAAGLLRLRKTTGEPSQHREGAGSGPSLNKE